MRADIWSGDPPAIDCRFHGESSDATWPRSAAACRIVNQLRDDAGGARRALVAGLRASPARIPPKYLYDALGCALFGAICELPEYYPTRVERAIFDAEGDDIARAIGRCRQFVDLGAGDGRKAERWLRALAPRCYVAVDIAANALQATLTRMAREFPGLELRGVVADFTLGLDLHAELDDEPTTFFYPGSSIGNFPPADALDFLDQIRRHCIPAHSGLLIGVDTKKDPVRLRAAYDDALGVTAAFNRNVLNHVNRVIGSDFSVDAFAHRCVCNAGAGRIEMYVEALTPMTVRIDGAPRAFGTGERILTEYSCKYAPAEFSALLTRAGFGSIRCWQDACGDFAVFLAR